MTTYVSNNTPASAASVGYAPFNATQLRTEGNNIIAGRYRVEVSEHNVKIYDTKTNQWVHAHGDPHFHTGDGDKGQFHDQNLTLDLADGVKITIKVTPKNGEGLAFIESVAVMRNGEAVVARGVSDNQAGIQMGTVLNNAGSVDREWADGTVLRLANEANLDDLVFAGTNTEFIGGDASQRFGEIMFDGKGGTSQLDYAKYAARENAGNVVTQAWNPYANQNPNVVSTGAALVSGRVPVEERPEYKPMFTALNAARGDVSRLNAELAAETDPDKRKEILVKLQEARQEVSFILNMISNMLKQESDDRLAVVRNLRTN